MATIVVVEDQPDNLKLITALLTMKGHRVVGLTSGEPLVATLLAEQPPPRLVLLDIQLPGRDGYKIGRAPCRERGYISGSALSAHISMPSREWLTLTSARIA